MSGINTPVELRISFGRKGDGTVTPTIRITDRVSHSVIADIEIEGEDLTELLAGGQVISVVNLPDQEQYHRIGKRQEILRVPAKDFAHLGSRREMGVREKYTNKPDDAMKQYGDDRKLSEGYDVYQWSYHNYGWDLTLRRWVETTEDERIERADRHFVGI